MKVLIVCSATSGKISPFVLEQANSLVQNDITIEYFTINKNGLIGYLSHYRKLIKRINEYNPKIVHAHYGLCGFLSNLQRKKPVITTFHGSDINDYKVIIFSMVAHWLSLGSIFVSEKISKKIFLKKKQYLIPCGVDVDFFTPIDNKIYKKPASISDTKTNILFSSSFDNKVKNYPLAQKSCEILENKFGIDVNLIELKGFSRAEVRALLCFSDIILLTSFTEGSPQIVKEAMSCNRPIVTTDVGDVSWLGENVDHFKVVNNNPLDIAMAIISVLKNKTVQRKYNGREKLLKLALDNDSIAKKIIKAYTDVFC